LSIPQRGVSFSFQDLKFLNQLFLLLEDVLQLSKSGLHLLQGELVLTLSRFVLGDPAVQFSDGVIKEDPFLQEDVDLLNPFIGGSLDLVVPFLESCNLTISFGMSGHLLSCSLSSCQNLVVVDSSGIKFADLLIESLDLVKISRLAEAFASSLLSSNQPGSELLDSSSVLSPELDIVGVFVTLNLGSSSQISDNLVILASSSFQAWASAGTLSP